MKRSLTMIGAFALVLAACGDDDSSGGASNANSDSSPAPSVTLVDVEGLGQVLADPDGMDTVKSDVMLALWDAFKQEGIRVPYPVREIRIRGGALPVETTVEVPN